MERMIVNRNVDIRQGIFCFTYSITSFPIMLNGNCFPLRLNTRGKDASNVCCHGMLHSLSIIYVSVPYPCSCNWPSLYTYLTQRHTLSSLNYRYYGTNDIIDITAIILTVKRSKNDYFAVTWNIARSNKHGPWIFNSKWASVINRKVAHSFQIHLNSRTSLFRRKYKWWQTKL